MDVINIVNYMDVWVKPLFGVLIADEVCHVVPYVMSLDLNWYGTIVSGWDFQCRFYDCDIVMLFAVSAGWSGMSPLSV